MQPLRELFEELSTDLLVPSLVASTLVAAAAAALLAWVSLALVNARRRRRARSLDADLSGLADGADVTLHGTLTVDGDGASLTHRGARVRLAATAGAWASGEEVIARGRLRRVPTAEGGDAYREGATRPELVDVSLRPVRVRRAGAWLSAGALAGALLGAVAGVVAPSVVLPRVLVDAPRATRFRVRAVEPCLVEFERVADDLDPSCRVRLLTPPRWGIDRARCLPTLRLDASAGADELAGVIRRLDPRDPRSGDVRALERALGWPRGVMSRPPPRDPEGRRHAVVTAFADARYDEVLALARAMPRAERGAVAAEVVTAALITRAPHEHGQDGLLREVVDDLSPEHREAVQCIQERWPATASTPAREPTPSRARAMLRSRAPACVILGATALGDEAALRALAALPRGDDLWRPVVDAARNHVLLDGIASGRIRAPDPTRVSAFGDAAEQRATLHREVAELLEATGALLETRGYKRLAWQVRLPAQEAIAAAALPEQVDLDGTWRFDRLAVTYRRVLDEYALVATRDRRLDRRWRETLAADLARVERPPSPDADYTFLAPASVSRALEALRRRDPGALAAALGPPSPEALAAAAVLSGYRHADDAWRCSVDPLVRAWVLELPERHDVAALPWRDVHAAQLAREAMLERLSIHGARAEGRRTTWPPHASPYFGGAFVASVTEALQRELAARR